MWRHSLTWLEIVAALTAIPNLLGLDLPIQTTPWIWQSRGCSGGRSGVWQAKSGIAAALKKRLTQVSDCSILILDKVSPDPGYYSPSPWCPRALAGTCPGNIFAARRRENQDLNLRVAKFSGQAGRVSPAGLAAHWGYKYVAPLARRRAARQGRIWLAGRRL
jgi:hypothetical protein